MARLDALVIGRMRHHDAFAVLRIYGIEGQQPLTLGLRILEMLKQHLGRGAIKIVAAVFLFRLAEDIAVCQRDRRLWVVEGHLHHMVDPQHIHRQPLQPIGQLARNRAAVMPAHLLEIGELAHLHPVAPDFPAQTPGPQRGAFPVILHEPDVMQHRVQPDRAQTAQIQILQIGGRGFDDHLILIVMLQAVRVLAITPIRRAARRLHIGRSPGVRPQRAQRGCRVKGACPHLHVIRLQHGTALGAPIGLQAQDDLLKAAGKGCAVSHGPNLLKTAPSIGNGQHGVNAGRPSHAAAGHPAGHLPRPQLGVCIPGTLC